MTQWIRMALAGAVIFGIAAHDDAYAKGGKDKKGPDKVGPIKKDKYPKQVRYRPLTMAKGMAQVGLDLDWTLWPDPVKDVIGSRVGVDYGLAPTVDVRVSTGLRLSPDTDWDNTLGVGLGYLAYDTAEFDLALRLDLAAQLQDGGQTAIILAAPMRYLIGDMWDLHGSVAVPVYFDPDFFIAPSLNPGVGLQASGPVYLELNTTIFTFYTLANTDPTHLGNVLPIDFRLTYAIDRQWDVGAHVGLPIVWADGVKEYPTIGIFGRGRF